MDCYDVIVIGQGYSGLIASNLCAKHGLKTANFESETFGGLVLNINNRHPSPHGEASSGVELASTLAMENMDLGVTGIPEAVSAISKENCSFTVTSDGGRYSAKHVIVASGARLRKLGIPGEAEFFGQGVSNCGDCDGPMFQGKGVVVVGGGDSAFQEALTLSAFAQKITTVYRGAAPQARADSIVQVANEPKVTQLKETTVIEIVGSVGVDALRVQTRGGEKILNCAGVFIFPGLEPNTRFLPSALKLSAVGTIVTSDNGETSLSGLWAIGAVRHGFGGRRSPPCGRTPPTPHSRFPRKPVVPLWVCEHRRPCAQISGSTSILKLVSETPPFSKSHRSLPMRPLASRILSPRSFAASQLARNSFLLFTDKL